ncbi:MAG: HAD family hydrolase [Anaerolineae bacterium]|jgi:HAD superfamily hydrolase (TIGR01549 family)|nr:HAD family hydrolase [Anaerolineae bacterium]
MALRGVIFDMGGTLLYYSPPGKSWEDMEKIGAQGVYDHLLALDYDLPPLDTALDAAWAHAEAQWATLSTAMADVTRLKLAYQLKDLAQQWGVNHLSPETIDVLVKAYATAIQAFVVPLTDAQDTLRALREQGFRVGLISNTLWPGSYHVQDLDRYGLTPYFEHMIFSADVDAWKPYKNVFQLSLDALDLKPEEAVYVGDSLYFDVWGAQQAGLRAVWVEQEMPWLPDDSLAITPDATITALPDLLDIVNGWR